MGKCYEEISRDINTMSIEIPTDRIEVCGLGDTIIGFTFEMVQNCLLVLRTELLKHEDLYKGFLASINSVLDENLFDEHGFSQKELAEKILNRIIGEE